MLVDLISILLGSEVSEQTLVHQDSKGKPVLSGENFTKILVPRARRLLPAENSILEPLAASFNASIAKVASALDHALLTNRQSLADHGPRGYGFFISFGAILLALSRIARTVLRNDTAVHTLDSTRMLQELITTYREELAASWSSDTGYEIERLLGAGIPFVAYAVASKPTINRSKFVDPSKYNPLHVHPDCSCAFLGPNASDVIGLLSKNRIPVVVALDDGQLSVRDSVDGDYVAISHVWADGLGSTTEEGLPRCQVARLARLARDLVPGGAFWVDALCVPQDKGSRRRAIGLMARTYEEASKVLVIDGGVRAQCSLASPKEECLLRIATSGWMQRVWTLQEGMLARELYFQLSDGLVDCGHFDGAPYAIAKEVVPLLQHRPRDDVALTFGSVLEHAPRCTFNEIIPLLRHRTTSKPEDEAIAIAGLLGVDASELAALPTAESRMRMLLMRCGALPRCIAVYGWQSRKLDLPGFTWAPISVGEVFWWGDPLDPLWATATEEGLLGLYTVVHFAPVDMGRLNGLVAIVTQDGDSDSTHIPPELDRKRLLEVKSLSARTDRVTPGVQIEISPLFVSMRKRAGHSLRVNALLVTRLGLPPTEREEPIAAVFIPELDGAVGTRPGSGGRLRCEFVAAGKLQVDPPTVSAEPNTKSWRKIEAKVMSLVPVVLA